MWQMLASVALPGLTIKAVAKTATHICHLPSMTKRFSPSLLKFAPTAIGLFVIPIIIKPIDNFVDEIMDDTYRKYFFVKGDCASCNEP